MFYQGLASLDHLRLGGKTRLHSLQGCFVRASRDASVGCRGALGLKRALAAGSRVGIGDVRLPALEPLYFAGEGLAAGTAIGVFVSIITKLRFAKAAGCHCAAFLRTGNVSLYSQLLAGC